MDHFHAAVLGALQGLTEVLPISSSAHLILIPRLLGWPESGLTFDVALHLGTLIALSIYFRRDIVELASNFFRGISGKRLAGTTERLPFYIIAGTIPAIIVGKTLENHVEELFRQSPALISAFLIGFALLLAYSDTTGTKRLQLDSIGLKAAVFIGLAQCLALIPGVSRSGITITAALLIGYNREAAARFSFLLSLPIVAGAAILKLGHLVQEGSPAGEGSTLATGVATSAFFGYFSIVFLLKYIRRSSLYPFVWYRIIAGSAMLLYIFIF